MPHYTNLQLKISRCLMLCLLTVFSCNSTKTDKNLIGLADLLIIKGKKPIISDNGGTIIIQYVDFDCSSCIQQVLNWQNFFEENNLPLEDSLYLIGYGDYHRIQLVTKQIDFKGNILFDKNEEFHNRNSSFELKEKNCIIIKNNQKHQL